MCIYIYIVITIVFCFLCHSCFETNMLFGQNALLNDFNVIFCACNYVHVLLQWENGENSKALDLNMRQMNVLYIYIYIYIYIRIYICCALTPKK
jgi:hypothetical protein